MVAHKDDHGEHQGDQADGLILTLEKGLCALADGVGDGLHLGGAGVGGDDGTGEEEGEKQRYEGDADGDPEIKTAVGGR